MKSFFDHLKEDKMAKEKIATGIRVSSFSELDKMAKEASAKNAGSYISAYVDFGMATIFKMSKLPTNAYASDDWKHGYWRNGKHFTWSDARKQQTQRAIDRLSGTQ